MKTKYLLVIALGLWTAILSYWVISPAISELRVPESSEVAATLLILGALLALGGSWAAWMGVRNLRSC